MVIYEIWIQPPTSPHCILTCPMLYGVDAFCASRNRNYDKANILKCKKMVTEQKRNFIQVESGLHINPCLKLRNHMFRSGSVEDHLWLVQEVGWLLDSQNGGKW